MRLKQIKLAGFKSFVDPTTVTLPGNRCSIVGPNGGGKSNIVDAIRWVMGESSARQLRGESLTDVIFHGCRTRKPLGVAAIELIFDNSKGRIGGEYAAFGEIAIRRQVNSEAQSVYFLNGARCRRRDVVDVFLGTGFGPRSYSIIEQGMISQLVQARPEDLRVYLEEAAGISKYKERRRETENRIKHTRENLERLRDTREELGRTLERLRKQAKAAERYKKLKADERRCTAELHAIGYLDLSVRLDELEQELRRKEADFERLRAEQQSVETAIAEARVHHEEASRQSSDEQALYYRLGENIGRIEESLQFNRGRAEECERELEELHGQLAETERQLNMDQSDIDELETTIAGLTPAVETARQADAEAAARLKDVERAYARWQEEWDEFRRQSAESSRTAQIQTSRIEHSGALIENLRRRIDQLAEDEREPSGVETGRVDSLAAEIETLEQNRRGHDDKVERCLEQLALEREDILVREAELEEARHDLQSLRHDLAGLQAAQRAALGRSDDEVHDWLTDQGLGDAPRVGETLSVVPGWERAVEMVLGDFLQGLRVDDAASFAQALSSLSAGHLALVEARLDSVLNGDLPSLNSLIRSSDLKLGSILHGVYAAESDDVALGSRTSLNPGESIVTRSGLWIGPDWLRKLPATDSDARIIERRQDLDALEVRVEEAELALADLQSGLDDARNLVRRLEEQRENLQALADETREQLAELKADHGVQQVRLEAADAHRGRLQRDRAGLEEQMALENASLAEARERLKVADQAVRQFASVGQSLTDAKERLVGELEKVRQAARDRHDEFHGLNGELQGHVTRLEAIRTARERLVERVGDFARRRSTLQTTLEQSRAPLTGLQAELETKLAEQHEVDERQRNLRTRLDELGGHIRERETARDEAASRVEAARAELESGRVAREGLNVERAGTQERVEATGHRLADVLQELPENASADVWAQRLERLDRSIRRLEPVNLAAIEEYDTEAERKAWLDSQHDDLDRALNTLQAAIRKIDAETRARFRETFEQVNGHLEKLFPKLFGGGQARLIMTGEDLLDTGVSLLARPPGKRNARVHQLSGGEKALAAVALIFAIFQLNPSPVCVLDEVDAPLDDNNVGRVAELIHEMSRDVQFVVITHNKLTMEMADHLIGVTMSEPGVSRLVSVDIEEAAAMAAS